MTEKKSFGYQVKEFFRKIMVSIKRNPQNIALVVLLASFLTYSLSLTKFSNTTAYINKTPMGLCEFVSMLFSILAMVCFLNSFPKRQKTKWVMVAIMFAMIAAIIAVDIVYYIKVGDGIIECIDDVIKKVTENGGTAEQIATEVAKWKTDYAYCYTTQKIIIAQIVLLGVASLLVALLPVYRPLLNKINTSIDIEGNDDMQAIELEEDKD